MYPHILLQIDEKRQDELIKKIKCLNGVYVESKFMIATHFVCDELTCSELFIHACVRGLWILSSKYIDDSYEMGSWLKEDNYGHCQTDSPLNSELISAANRWHWKFSVDQEQPFTEWNVALDLKLANCDFYQRVLEHGGANVTTFDSTPNPRDFQNVTYIFLGSTNSEFADDLLDYGLLCLNTQFIIDTVIKDEILNPFDYVIKNSMPISQKQDFSEDQTNALSIHESYQIFSCHFKTALFIEKQNVHIKTISQYKQESIEEIVPTSLFSKIHGKRPAGIKIDKVNKQQKTTHANKSTDHKEQVHGHCALTEVSNTILHTKKAMNKDRNLFESLSPSIYIHGLEPPDSSQLGNKSPFKKSSSPSKQGQLSLFDFGYFTEELKPDIENGLGQNKKGLSTVDSSLKSIESDIIVISDDDDDPTATGNLDSQKSTSMNGPLFVSIMEKKCDMSCVTPDHLSKNTVMTSKANSGHITDSVDKVTNSSLCTKKQLKIKAFIETFNSYTYPPKSLSKKKSSKYQAILGIPGDNSTYQHLLVWSFSFPIQLNPTIDNDTNEMKQVPNLYGEWMASAREMDFPDIALTYATPSLEKKPAPVLIRQLQYLLQAPDMKDSSKANCYIQSWLRLHPPNTKRMIKCYNSLNDHTAETNFLEMIDLNLNKQNFLCVSWILEFCVSLFEINWNHCLKQSTKKDIQKSMVVSWLWHSPYVVQHDATSNKVLRILKTILLLPAFKLRLCQAVFSLVALVAECIRLANVQWDSANQFFTSDPIIALAHDLSELLCSSSDNFEILMANIHSVKPDWLRTLVVAKILSSKYSYLLIQKFQVNHLSWTSIVNHFFYLMKEIKETNTNAMLEATDLKLQNKHIGTKANKRDHKGESPVHVACRKNNVEKLQVLLLIPGVDINLKDNAGWTPLHEACCHGSFECVVLLLNYIPCSRSSSKLDINTLGPGGITPLMDAVIHSHEHICRELLKHGGKALLLTKTEQGCTALDFAKTDCMKAILNEPETLITEIKSVYLSSEVCTKYILLLSVLLSSYYSYTISIQQCCPNASFHSVEDSNILLNILSHFYVFKNNVQSLTKPSDHTLLENSFLCLELLCETLQDID